MAARGVVFVCPVGMDWAECDGCIGGGGIGDSISLLEWFFWQLVVGILTVFVAEDLVGLMNKYRIVNLPNIFHSIRLHFLQFSPSFD